MRYQYPATYGSQAPPLFPVLVEAGRVRVTTDKNRRGGFTLLEVVLALTIGILLMSALYVAVDIQLRHAQAGREIVERSTLVRSLMTRIAADISKSVGVNTPVLATQSSMSGQAGGMGGRRQGNGELCAGLARHLEEAAQ